MGRTRKGRAVSGWLVVDKPAGMTSTDVVNRLRWAFQAQKAGHAGTLDPAATGLLAVALGEATKTIPLIADALKAYRFRVTFGSATDTDDAEGRITEHRENRPSDAAIEAALAQFRGQIFQVPPQYSAVKVDGERAYDLAREGIESDLAARPLWVDRLDMVARPDADHAEFEMVCGKGGYVRSIARDLGQALGCLGHVAWLRRLWSGPFVLDGALTMDTVNAIVTGQGRGAALDGFLLPLETALALLPEVRATAEGAARLRHGNAGTVITAGLDWGSLCWASHQGRAVALGHYRGGELHPSRVFQQDSDNTA